MSFALILSSVMDPFRIGLMLALVLTMARTRPATGVVLPLAAGAGFVAYLIPATLGSGLPMMPAFVVGLAANAVILAVILLVVLVVRAVALRRGR